MLYKVLVVFQPILGLSSSIFAQNDGYFLASMVNDWRRIDKKNDKIIAIIYNVCLTIINAFGRHVSTISISCWMMKNSTYNNNLDVLLTCFFVE